MDTFSNLNFSNYSSNNNSSNNNSNNNINNNVGQLYDFLIECKDIEMMHNQKWVSQYQTTFK